MSAHRGGTRKPPCPLTGEIPSVRSVHGERFLAPGVRAYITGFFSYETYHRSDARSSTGVGVCPRLSDLCDFFDEVFFSVFLLDLSGSTPPPVGERTTTKSGDDAC